MPPKRPRGHVQLYLEELVVLEIGEDRSLKSSSDTLLGIVFHGPVYGLSLNRTFRPRSFRSSPKFSKLGELNLKSQVLLLKKPDRGIASIILLAV
jgi:hypothetical protein